MILIDFQKLYYAIITNIYKEARTSTLQINDLVVKY